MGPSSLGVAAGPRKRGCHGAFALHRGRLGSSGERFLSIAGQGRACWPETAIVHLSTRVNLDCCFQASPVLI